MVTINYQFNSVPIPSEPVPFIMNYCDAQSPDVIESYIDINDFVSQLVNKVKTFKCIIDAYSSANILTIVFKTVEEQDNCCTECTNPAPEDFSFDFLVAGVNYGILSVENVCSVFELSNSIPGCCYNPSELELLRRKMYKYALNKYGYINIVNALTKGKVGLKKDKTNDFETINDLFSLINYIILLKINQSICLDVISNKTLITNEYIECFVEYFMCKGIDIKCLLQMANLGNYNNCCQEEDIEVSCPCENDVPLALDNTYDVVNKALGNQTLPYIQSVQDFTCCSGDETVTVLKYTSSNPNVFTVNNIGSTALNSYTIDVVFNASLATVGTYYIYLTLLICGEEVTKNFIFQVVDQCEPSYPTSGTIEIEVDVEDGNIQVLDLDASPIFTCCPTNSNQRWKIQNVANTDPNLGITLLSPNTGITINSPNIPFQFLFDASKCKEVPYTGFIIVDVLFCDSQIVKYIFKFNVINNCQIVYPPLDPLNSNNHTHILSFNSQDGDVVNDSILIPIKQLIPPNIVYYECCNLCDEYAKVIAIDSPSSDSGFTINYPVVGDTYYKNYVNLNVEYINIPVGFTFSQDIAKPNFEEVIYITFELCNGAKYKVPFKIGNKCNGEERFNVLRDLGNANFPNGQLGALNMNTLVISFDKIANQFNSLSIPVQNTTATPNPNLPLDYFNPVRQIVLDNSYTETRRFQYDCCVPTNFDGVEIVGVYTEYIELNNPANPLTVISAPEFWFTLQAPSWGTTYTFDQDTPVNTLLPLPIQMYEGLLITIHFGLNGINPGAIPAGQVYQIRLAIKVCDRVEFLTYVINVP